MLNPDDEHTATAEIASEERTASQRKKTTGAEIDLNKRAASAPASTAEVAKDLGRQGGESIDGAATVFPDEKANDFRTRWTDIQSGFVDEPRRSVEQADALVAEVIKCLADSFAQERSRLERQWGRGDDVSTEELRVALQRYRAFFDRLLNV